MSIIQLEIDESLIINETSDVLKSQFNNYCDWCWGHGYGNCDKCKKVFNHYYLPLKIKEKQKELGIECNKQTHEYRYQYYPRYKKEEWLEKHKRKKLSR